MHFLGPDYLLKFEWLFHEQENLLLRTFLTKKGISKRLLSKIKFHGGNIKVNGEKVNVLKELSKGDHIELFLPKEKDNPYLLPFDAPLDILYEDDHFLIVNKPAGVAAVPSMTHKNGTMANRVKYYTMKKEQAAGTVHVVTRLDKDTSGAMIFAKHSFAHSQLDRQLRNREIIKHYSLIVEGRMTKETHGWIDAPIARTEDSIITRRVHPTGKEALTEYWVLNKTKQRSLLEVRLHTGRTHQIRVHFAHIGHPLAGDELYGGKLEGMQRQALHCSYLSFQQPFSGKTVKVTCELPSDFQDCLLEEGFVGNKNSRSGNWT